MQKEGEYPLFFLKINYERRYMMNPKLREKIMESLSAVLPITAIVFLITVFLVDMDLGHMIVFLCGAIMLIVGMGFFQLGAEMAMTPLGEGIGVQTSKSKKMPVILLIGFVMGFIVTISEPDLQVLAELVPGIDNSIITYSVALGVGVFLVLAIFRICRKISLSHMLMIFYGMMLIIQFFVPKNFISVAFDAGGVTTGPMTVPFIMAMGVGLASVRSDKDSENDSFGLVALSSVGPILAVMMLGIFSNTDPKPQQTAPFPEIETMRDVARVFVHDFPHVAKNVFMALFPILIVFVLFQLVSKRYHGKQTLKIAIGFVYTYIGLVLFLCGVESGFAPVGSYLGEQLGKFEYNWVLIPIGMLVGYYIVKAEPAIQILNHQVENVTDGAISVRAMNSCMSVGVAVSVGLAMLRVLTGIPIAWIVIPGYIVALVMSKFVPSIFVGIAFDSGGVASGPMTSTFLLPLSIGVCTAVGGNVASDAFGVVALVALTPLIAIQIMGLVYRFKAERKQNVAVVLPDEIDEIIELEVD